MSESLESSPAPSHPTLGGKTLQSLARPRYKSWRKKYRKMHSRFDHVLEENKRFFKDEQKLEGIAKRLREELDGLLELCLDLNQSPALPPELRFEVRHKGREGRFQLVPEDISPEEANKMLMTYTAAVRQGHHPAMDLHIVRQQIDERLAAQGVESVETLEKSLGLPPQYHAGAQAASTMTYNETSAEDDGHGDDTTAAPAPSQLVRVSYLTSEQEDAYLALLDARSQQAAYPPASLAHTQKQREILAQAESDKHWAELTPRELERQVELLNPQSQHSWLKTHTKGLSAAGGGGNVDVDDTESLASHDGPSGKTGGSARKRGGKDKALNLAKQVGDRAVERASRAEGGALGHGRGGGGGAESGTEDDNTANPSALGDLSASGGGAGSSKKRTRDPDGTYRLKGSKGAASGRGKRKRSAGEMEEGLKRAKIEAQEVVSTPGLDGEGGAGVRGGEAEERGEGSEMRMSGFGR